MIKSSGKAMWFIIDISYENGGQPRHIMPLLQQMAYIGDDMASTL